MTDQNNKDQYEVRNASTNRVVHTDTKDNCIGYREAKGDSDGSKYTIGRVPGQS